jgi:MAF protein
MSVYSIVLASTSPFRQQLLEKLAVPFHIASPSFDETPLPDEGPFELVKRLAKGKAESCSVEKPSLIIGSDQVCVIDGEIIGKPLSRAKAIEQLSRQSGRKIKFYTGLAVYNTVTTKTDVKVDTFTVHFRSLSQKKIERYIDKEEPFSCAGSFMCEGLGIALFEKLEGKDPNTLIGLPLIDLIDMLEEHGVEIL